MNVGIETQGTEFMPRVERCAVKGCDGWAVDGPYCGACGEEIEALDRWARDQERREVLGCFRREERRRRLRRWAGRMREFAVALLVGCGLIYIAWHLGMLFMNWTPVGW